MDSYIAHSKRKTLPKIFDTIAVTSGETASVIVNPQRSIQKTSLFSLRRVLLLLSAVIKARVRKTAGAKETLQRLLAIR